MEIGELVCASYAHPLFSSPNMDEIPTYQPQIYETLGETTNNRFLLLFAYKVNNKTVISDAI